MLTPLEVLRYISGGIMLGSLATGWILSSFKFQAENETEEKQKLAIVKIIIDFLWLTLTSGSILGLSFLF